ncbi:MAG: sugar nucleotide-binding protein [Planctomycetaceae bacterium]
MQSGWADAAAKAGCRFTALTSGALFTGPWMFHTEDSHCYCDSPEAANLRTMEEAIQSACPAATIIRTHVFGWTPDELPAQSIDMVIDKLEAGEPFAGNSFASPILAEQLAEILVRIDQVGLTGLYHIGSAERCNPQQFAAHVAREFGLDSPEVEPVGIITYRPSDYGQGETSLHCSKLRKLLGIGFPLVSDGIRLLALKREKQSLTYPGYFSSKAA